MIGIYKITSPTGKVYIGQSVNKGRLSIQGNRKKKVINTETGEIFVSIKAAAESIGMEVCNLSNRLNGLNKKNDTNLIYLKEYGLTT